MEFVIRNIFLLYAFVGTIVAGVTMVQADGSWSAALEGGGQEALFALLLIALGITSSVGHLFLGDRVVAGQGHAHNDASRMFQWELGVLLLIISVVAMVVPVSQQVPLAMALGLFFLAAAIRHAIKREPLNTVIGDVGVGGLLLAASLPSL
jgi:hypothetical protein